MPPRLRKFVLTLHIMSSVGWLGAVAAFLALSIYGVLTTDAFTARAVYLSMEAISWAAIVPCCLLALISGLIQSLGAHWGLFRHYWVLVKFLLTCGASLMLIVHMQPIIRLSRTAAAGPLLVEHLRTMQVQLVFDASLTMLVLLTTTALSVYKPWGLTQYGRRKMGAAAVALDAPYNAWGRVVVTGVLFFMLVFVLSHLAGRGPGGH